MTRRIEIRPDTMTITELIKAARCPDCPSDMELTAYSDGTHQLRTLHEPSCPLVTSRTLEIE